MSLFMNNRLIVSKQYHRAFYSQNIALHQYFSGFEDYSSSTKPKQFRIGHIACHIHGTFDYLNYPYYPAYTG